jgi:hypothetical protein
VSESSPGSGIVVSFAKLPSGRGVFPTNAKV